MADARERVIERRDTHLDQLTDKLREPRGHTAISELLGGAVEPGLAPPSEDDQLYVQDLGLIRTRPQIGIANPIYREIIPRALTWVAQTRIPQETTWYIRAAGGIDFPKLLDAFQHFFRENSEIWIERFDYKEASPQLLMQAFLLVQWPLDADQGFHGPAQRVVVELKILHKSLEATIAEGLVQTADYMDRVGAEEGYLVVFDRTPETPWEKKVFVREEQSGRYQIGVWGM